MIKGNVVIFCKYYYYCCMVMIVKTNVLCIYDSDAAMYVFMQKTYKLLIPCLQSFISGFRFELPPDDKKAYYKTICAPQ